MSSPAPPDHVQAFREALAESTGLRFPADKTPMLAEMLRGRADTVRLSLPAYIARLRSDPREAVELARRLTVSETYFLRHAEQFHGVSELLRAREASGDWRWRALCAGCASGEEAYSLAITFCETVRHPEAWQVSILGVDIHPEVIAHARTGIYGAWSLRATPQNLRDRYFRVVGDRFSIVAPLRRMVSFEWRNLADDKTTTWEPSTFDVVFCRNVLMYFARDVARRVVATFERTLVPGGALFLGSAEHLRHWSTDFEVQHAHGAFHYRTRAGAAPPKRSTEERRSEDEPTADLRQVVLAPPSEHVTARPQVDPDADAETESTSPAVQGRPPLAGALQLWKEERFAEALALLSAHTGDEPSGEVLLLRSMLLLTLDMAREAQAVCAELLAHEAQGAAAHYVEALCHEHLGELPEAVESSRTAIYLDHAFAMPHLQLGRLARRWGDLATARRELQTALRLLPHEQDRHVVLFGGGFSRGGLLQVCQAELDACGGAS